MDLLSIKDIVKDLLTNVPSLRDNDNRLILNVWSMQDSNLKNATISFRYFTKQFIQGDLAPAESIRRVRQALQEEFPELRGKLYAERHKLQDSVKEQLNQPEMKKGGTP